MDHAGILEITAQPFTTVLMVPLCFVMMEHVKNLLTNVTLPFVHSENTGVQMALVPVLLVVLLSHAQLQLLISVLIIHVKLMLEIVYLKLNVLFLRQFVALIIPV